MPELLDFGKHTAYVWSTVGLSLVVLIWNVLSARLQMKKATITARRRLATSEGIE